MNYKTKYIVPFKAFNNADCVIEIQQDEYSRKIIELKGGTSPFIVELNTEEFLYAPTRFSTATLKLVGDDYMRNLLSTDYQQYRVILKRNGIITWTGFISPELYTQDYSSTPFELEMQCISAMSSTEYIDYKKDGDDSIFVSIQYLIEKIIIASNGLYNSIYIPHVYARSEADYEKGINILNSITVSEQDFFDEDNKPMKLKEILEEICKFLGWTCVDWSGSLYFIDVDHTGRYFKYSSDFSSYELVDTNLMNIQGIGFSGSDNKLDAVGGYNKTTVRANNYSMDNLLPEEDIALCEEFTSQEYREGNNVYLYKYYKPIVYDLSQYRYDSTKRIYVRIDESEITTDNIKTNCGGSLIERCNYDDTNKPSKLDWETVVRFKKNSPESSTTFFPEWMLSYKKGIAIASYIDMAVTVNFDIQFSENADGFHINGESPEIRNPRICLKLQLGKFFWNGKAWKEYDTYFFADLEGSGSGWLKLKNTNQFTNKYNDVDDGYYIELPNSSPLLGSFKLTIAYPTADYNNYNCFFVKNIKVNCSRSDSGDRLYENIVNEKYINELEEIELKINTWNDDTLSFSKVIMDGNYLTDNLYSYIENGNVRLEEQLIKRIVNQYKATKIKPTQVLIYNPDLTPFTRLSDNYMVNMKFMPIGGSIDYESEEFKCIMLEVNGYN